MKILYVAKHDSGGNDDEGAISHALEVLGHTVISVREQEVGRVDLHSIKADLLLCHGWHDLTTMRSVQHMPKAFWYFDRVNDPDPSLINRNKHRMTWVNEITHVADIGFCTDGDWVTNDTSGKLHWLTQGADERVVGRGTPLSEQQPPILITASVLNGGDRRHRFIADFKERWGSSVRVVERGVHGRAMANLIASAKVVVAPQHPSSDRYWSNRVYQALGFGAFMLHPRCEGMSEFYTTTGWYYDDDQHLDALIGKDILSHNQRWLRSLADVLHEETLLFNLYRHRVERLLAIVKEKLG